MRGIQYSIWIETEEWPKEEWNVYGENIDAKVTFEDGA